jgi:hypothetical protein
MYGISIVLFLMMISLYANEPIRTLSILISIIILFYKLETKNYEMFNDLKN